MINDALVETIARDADTAMGEGLCGLGLLPAPKANDGKVAGATAKVGDQNGGLSHMNRLPLRPRVVEPVAERLFAARDRQPDTKRGPSRLAVEFDDATMVANDFGNQSKS